MNNITLGFHNDKPIELLGSMANRHGLIAGATGTGKSVTLKILAEQFSNMGVPVFLSDVKGDLSGLAQAGNMSDKLQKRLDDLSLPTPAFSESPVIFWDMFAEKGHPVRTTVSEMGPVVLSQLLNLNDTQTGVLTVAFCVADDQGMLLLDFKDIRSMLQHVSENRKELQQEYGNISPASVGAIQRKLLALKEQGAEEFFGEPALCLEDFMQTDENGKGFINILEAQKLMMSPKLYACFLLWMLSELFENLPEVGDSDKPKLVFFFDEAHLLFDNISDALEDKLEQVVRLIRSKGVGIYFITQNPTDIPESVLGQLGNRVQHALRAFTPKDQKAVKAAAQTFRTNPELDVKQAITELGVGEALVSVLDENGIPSIVQRTWLVAPCCAFKPIDETKRKQILQSSIVAGVYEEAFDRVSAYEQLTQRAQQRQELLEQQEAQKEQLEQQRKEQAQREKQLIKEQKAHAKELEKQQRAHQKAMERMQKQREKELKRQARQREKMMNRVVGNLANSAARSIGSKVGRSLVRGLLGSLLGR